ncbi:MAG: phosphoadenylyl-sulfate reductase, partial [Deltaproteobacteria bacterium]
MSKAWSEEELKKVSDGLEGKDPVEAVRWAVDNFSREEISLACSFGAEDVALVDMLVKINPKARIFYLDTDLLFKESIEVKDRLIERYGISPERYGAKTTLEEMAKEFGEGLWKKEPDRCCNIRKMLPLAEALSGLRCWITGIRRDQAPTRANAPVVSWDAKFKLVKVNPLVRWTSEDVWNYIKKNNVPYNVLHDRNFPSIGCEPCT